MTYADELAEFAGVLDDASRKARAHGLPGLEESLHDAALSAASWADALRDPEPADGEAA